MSQTLLAGAEAHHLNAWVPDPAAVFALRGFVAGKYGSLVSGDGC